MSLVSSTRRQLGILLALGFCELTFASHAFAQLQLPPKAKKKKLNPAAELTQQLTGQSTIKLKHDGRNFYGSPLAFDGKSLVLLRWDGRVTQLPATKETKAELIDQSFLPYTHEELKSRLRKKFGERYAVSTTEHYVVVHPHGKPAIWAAPFEKLHQEFSYWFVKHGLQPKEPQFPLIAVVLRSRRDFDRFMKKEIDVTNRQILGFYSHKSNQMVMYDPSSRLRVADETWLFRDPTIVHEATHQTAFNTGVHNRFSPPPLWLTEGMAMMFEAPGYNRSRNFPAPKHRVNTKRLADLRKLQPRSGLPARMLGLVGDDSLFRTKPTEYYTLSWAFSWFLAEQHPDKFIRYLKQDAARKPYAKRGPRDELKLFVSIFGNDFEQLQIEIRDFYDKHW